MTDDFENWCHASCFAESIPIKRATTCFRCKEIIGSEANYKEISVNGKIKKLHDHCAGKRKLPTKDRFL